MKKMSFRIPAITRQQIESHGGTMTSVVVRAIDLLWLLTATDHAVVARYGIVQRERVMDWTMHPQAVFAFTYHSPSGKLCVEHLPCHITELETALHIYAVYFRINALIHVSPSLAHCLPISITAITYLEAPDNPSTSPRA